MEMIKRFISTQLRRVIYSEGATTLPWNIMLPLMFLTFFNSMTITMVFSFLPKLVKSFGTSEVDTGFYVGMIGSSVYVGRIFCSILWGYLADRYGRKKLIIVAASTTCIFTLAFGFTWSIEWAVVTRLLVGMSMGMVVIAKALIFQVTDDTNSSLGMAFLVAGFSLGLVVGPVIGGYLAFPGELYPETFSPDSIFSKFGILLPNLVLSILNTVAIISAIIFIPNVKKSARVTYIRMEDEQPIKMSYHEKTFLIQSSIKKENTPPTNYQIQITTSEFQQLPNSVKLKKSNGFKGSKIGQTIFDKGCFRACVLYALYGFVAVGFDELFPLYAATSRDYDGFGFSTSEIGTSLTIAAVVVLLVQFTVMARITQYFGLRKSFMYCCLVTTFFLPIIPLSHHIVNKSLFWFVMLSALIMLRFLIAFAFLIINVMLNNACDPELLGFFNGFALTVSTIARAITVPMVGSIFGWSLTNVKNVTENTDALGFPFNQYFAFFVLVIFGIFNTLFVFLLPESLDKKLVVLK